jgi:hypothetical protein
MTRDDDPEPGLPSPSAKQVFAEPDIIRRAVCLEFSRHLFEYATLKDRDALRTICELQRTLEWMFRIERRIYMRRGLTASSVQEARYYKARLGLWDGGSHAMEDFKAVKAHLDQGADLFVGLRRPSKNAG